MPIDAPLLGKLRARLATLRLGDPLDPNTDVGPMIREADAVRAVEWIDEAVAAGAKLLHPVKDQFYGDRNGGVRDFAGNEWWIATHIEDVPPAELERRAEEAMKRRQRG